MRSPTKLALVATLALLAAATLWPQQAPPAKKPAAKSQPRTKAPLAPEERAAEAVRLNNLGAALMNQQRMADALENFKRAAALDPKLSAAGLNQGIALLNSQKIEPARAILLEVVKQQSDSVRAWYNLGLLYRNAGEAEKALEAFQRAAALDAEDADAQYFVGASYAQLQQYAPAIAAFERAIKLNPFHVSAEFGLGRAYQRTGDAEKARAHVARFQHLTAAKLGAPLSLAYGDQGKYSLAEEVRLPVGTAAPAIPVKFVPVPASESGLDSQFLEAVPASRRFRKEGSGACFFDYDNDGDQDLFMVNHGEAAPSQLFANAGGKFKDVTLAAQLNVRGFGGQCAAGDYDNDGWVDLAVSFPDQIRLFRNAGNTTFREVTELAGLKVDGPWMGLTFFDFDHDGDLDLYATRARDIVGKFPARGRREDDPVGIPAANVLWRNNGNGTFTDWTGPTELESGPLDHSAVATDINNDRAVDLVVASYVDWGYLIFGNPREGPFELMRLMNTNLRVRSSVAVLDFNKDGWMDLFFGQALFRNAQGKRLESVPLPESSAGCKGTAAALDYDNDGWVDLACAGDEEVRVFRNLGGKGFQDVTSSVGLAGLRLDIPNALIALDYDGDGDSDFLVKTSRGPVMLLRNDGGNKNNWLKLSLKGLADNKSAIGTKVEVFAGATYQKFEVQSPNDLLIGLGKETRADVVRLLWPTGVLQDEIGLAANQRHTIVEIDRRGSSCPILFAWNGARYEFIADMIGPGIVGHWVGPGERNVPDSTEYLKVDGRHVAPSADGRLSFRFVEPMEEVVYLDQLRLLAVDHPRDVAVNPNEYFAAGLPPPEFKVVASRGARPPVSARDQRGRDVLPELLARDRRYVAGFADARFKGYAEPHWVELDLGEWWRGAGAGEAPLRLLLHGFTDYFTATSVYAAHQAGVMPIVPSVEAQDASGQWVRVAESIGFPAGLARTMVADLTGKLAPGARRIRIGTNLKIYWDQILIDTTPAGAAYRVAEVPLAEATLRFLGYPRELPGQPPADLRYSYAEVSATGPYTRHAGHYTRYGDVRALLERADDRFAILGTGDEVALEFDASALPALPAGWTRDYFFYADGFSKDMDFYAAHGDTVEPLPYHAMPAYPYPRGAARSEPEYLEYLLELNSRPASGRGAATYRFQFPPARRPQTKER
jgi:tetratricopeptide (TPR) repeat protein